MKTAVVYTSKVGNTKVAAEKIAKAIGADIFKLGTDDVDISSTKGSSSPPASMPGRSPRRWTDSYPRTM